MIPAQILQAQPGKFRCAVGGIRRTADAAAAHGRQIVDIADFLPGTGKGRRMDGMSMDHGADIGPGPINGQMKLPLAGWLPPRCTLNDPSVRIQQQDILRPGFRVGQTGRRHGNEPRGPVKNAQITPGAGGQTTFRSCLP
ncbi:hypothetical protein SDC9_188828 [bioreactor metagenome]|uniref:Uncharacterized protein n=1 Tax=bioreactor metagenome TaxID=1076179 RepID=A0A645HQE8_9ZZZZ